MQLLEHTDDVLEITRTAMQAIDQIFKPGFKYKKAVTILLEIMPKSKFSPNLFTDYSHQVKRAQLSDTLDNITQQYGNNTLSLGLCGRKEEYWKMNQERKSPNYLTEWNDLFRVR